MTPKPKVSIVIRSFNEQIHLPKLFASLKKQTVQDYEVLLVDSGSQDDSVSIAKKNGAKILSILKRDFSFGKALNIGCEAASSDIILFASAHVYPESNNWLALMIGEFKDSEVGLAYGRQRAGKTNKFSEGILLKNWFPDKTERHQVSSFCNNANCAIRKEIWLKLPYDETLTGLEDIAWAKSIRDWGWCINYNHRASIIHIHDETWGQVYNRYFREAIALSVIDPSVRISFIEVLSLFCRNAATDMEVAFQSKSLIQHFSEILKFRFLQFMGSWRGLNHPVRLNHDLIKRFYYPNEDNGHA
jgi:rhamnosyltransferase